ncbi:hypothetical protein pneo_cds_928 [Pandoravirus neocaledonia]|uniref:Uncharacterized protein n=1 Tax=Pandoravirus neocaledonia TaxID=2107708 RepID=A0A2U7UDV2_9VIRU|nr:hypothetical protein pneo_cds_928 [Pandoravirus neocaledonia]AVK76535.1 hypothetical protein pneo_cds_928 [Pandoravirus neocaledonia]
MRLWSAAEKKKEGGAPVGQRDTERPAPATDEQTDKKNKSKEKNRTHRMSDDASSTGGRDTRPVVAQTPHYALSRGARAPPATSTCAVVPTSAAPGWRPEPLSYAELLKKHAPKVTAMRIKARAAEARSHSAPPYLYETSELSLRGEMPSIRRYLAKRGYRAEYCGRAPCNNPQCMDTHTTIAVFW